MPGGTPRRGRAGDGLRGDARRFSHSRGTAARAAAPTHRLVYADETIGGTVPYAGGYLYLRPPGGRRLLDGRPAERPRRRPQSRPEQVTLETGVFKPRTDGAADRFNEAARSVQIDRSVMRHAGGPRVGRSKKRARRLEKTRFDHWTSASACCPAADEYTSLPRTGSAAVPRRWARRSASAREQGRGPRRAERTYRRRRNDVPPTRRRPREECSRLRPRTKFILRPAGRAPRGPDRLRAAPRARGSRAHAAPSGQRSPDEAARTKQPDTGSPDTPPCLRRATRTSCPRRRRANV